MSIYLKDGMVLLDSGKVATDAACCCSEECTFDLLPTCVSGDIDISGTYLISGHTVTLIGSATLINQPLVSFLGVERRFLCGACGSATTDCGFGDPPVEAPLDIEIYLSCREGRFHAHLFTSAGSVCGGIELSFGLEADFTPPVVSEIFNLSAAGGAEFCSGTCEGTMTLTFNNDC